MKKLIFATLMVLLSTGLFAQEINISASFDANTTGWFLGEHKMNPSSTISFNYLGRFQDEAIKLGLGASFWVPRSPEDDSRDITYSNAAVFGILQLYPFRFSGGNGNIADYFYARANIGYNRPILWGDWVDSSIKSSWGGFYYGLGGGFDTPVGIFVEFLYNNYKWGATVYGVGDRDGELETYAIAIGYKFSFGEHKY